MDRPTAIDYRDTNSPVVPQGDVGLVRRLRAWLRGRTGYDVVRIVLGLLLLVAAGLKGHELATSPVAGTGLLDSRWFLIGVVEFELFFGLWLLAGIYPRWTWAAALSCFCLFASVSLWKAISGDASCGCFGKVPVDPWYTFTLDALAVAALFRFRLASGRWRVAWDFRSPRFRVIGVAAIWLLVGIPAAAAMSAYEPVMLSEDGAILGDGILVILEPEKWTRKRFPLLPHIEDYPERLMPGELPLRERLAEGNWIVVLYQRDCPKCLEEMPKYEQLACRSAADPTAPGVALIEVPAYGEAGSLKRSPNAVCALGRLSDEKEWLVETPVKLLLQSAFVNPAD